MIVDECWEAKRYTQIITNQIECSRQVCMHFLIEAAQLCTHVQALVVHSGLLVCHLYIVFVKGTLQDVTSNYQKVIRLRPN